MYLIHTGIAFSILMVAACGREQSAGGAGSRDTAFVGLQERGLTAMGVDQYTSSHIFDSLPDGGRIELQRDVEDPQGTEVIREHLRRIAWQFENGDFQIPTVVHAQRVPGAEAMAAKADFITYTYSDLPRGGEVRITTTDSEAIAAVHEFMEFQRQDHRAEGHSH